MGGSRLRQRRVGGNLPVDSADVSNLPTRRPVQVQGYQGNGTVVVLNALAPAAKTSYVLTDAGALTRGALGVSPGDLVEDDGVNWSLVKAGAGGTVQTGTRVLVGSGALLAPLTNPDDRGKIGQFSSFTPILTTANDGDGVVVAGESAIDENQLFVYDAPSGPPTGVWFKSAGAAHALGGAQHTSDTLANLNTKISDATLDDVSGTRTPTAHAASHENGGSDEINVSGLSGVLADGQPGLSHALGGAKHVADTLANLNAKVSDATLDDSSASRPPSGAAGGDLTGTYPNPGVLDSAIDHGLLGGLLDDDHTQYALLAGRATGQTLIGGTAAGAGLALLSTSDATKGKVIFGAAGTTAYDEVNERFGIGTASPNAKLDVRGNPGASVGGFPSGALHVTSLSASEFANSVITGHNLFGGNTQLWYLGSTSSSNDNIALINRQSGSLALSAGGATRLTVESGGNVGIGTTAPATSAKLELASTTGSLLVPRMTTVQRDALTPVDGMVLYNSTLAQMQGRVAAAWVGLSGPTIGRDALQVAFDGFSFTSFTSFGDVHAGLNLPDSVTTTIGGHAGPLPTNLDTTVAPEIVLTLAAPTDGAPPGNIRIEVAVGYATDQNSQADATAHDVIVLQTKAVPGTAAASIGYVTATFNMGLVGLAAGEQVWIRVRRLGLDAADTYVGNVILVNAKLTFQRTAA